MLVSQSVTEQRQCTVEVIAFLHQCWEQTERGQVLQSDPFYDRNPLLTPEVVAKVLRAIEDLFEKEIKKFPGYHNNAQGIAAGEVLIPPQFEKLPYGERFALVQGVDRVMQKYRIEKAPEPEPVVYEGWEGC